MKKRKALKMIILKNSTLFNPTIKLNDLGKIFGITKQINWAVKNKKIVIIIDPRSPERRGK